MFSSNNNPRRIIRNTADLTPEDIETFFLAEYPFGSHVEDPALRKHLRKTIIDGMQKMNPIKYANLDVRAEHRDLTMQSNPPRRESYEQFYGENTGFMVAVGRDQKGNYIVRFDWSVYVQNNSGELEMVRYGVKDAINTARGNDYSAIYMGAYLVNELTKLAKLESPQKEVKLIGTSRGAAAAFFAAVASEIMPNKIILQTPMRPSNAQIDAALQMRNSMTNQANNEAENQERLSQVREITTGIRSTNTDLLVDWSGLFSKFRTDEQTMSAQIVVPTGSYFSGHINWDTHMEQYMRRIKDDKKREDKSRQH